MHTVTYRYIDKKITNKLLYFLDKSKHNKYKLLKHVVYKKTTLGLPLSTKDIHTLSLSLKKTAFCVDLF